MTGVPAFTGGRRLLESVGMLRRPHGMDRARGEDTGRTAMVIGLILVALPILLATVGPLITSQDPYRQDGPRFAAPSAGHWMGTDQLGRDVFSRLAHGGVLSLGGAVVIMAVCVTAGVIVGTLSAVSGRWLDTGLMRAVDAANGIPALIVPVAMLGVLGPSFPNLLLSITIGFIPAYVRICRTMALGIRNRLDVVSARMMGVSRTRIAFTHVARGIGPQLLVIVLLDIGAAATALAGLSYLGMGAQAPLPEWGAMLNDGQKFFVVAPWLLWFPCLMIAALILGTNLLGEWARDALARSQGALTT